MTDVELDKSAQLEQRVRELEAENARLAAESHVPDAGAAAGRAPRRSGWWRALLSAVCIVLAGVLLPVSIVAAWSRAQLVCWIWACAIASASPVLWSKLTVQSRVAGPAFSG